MSLALPKKLNDEHENRRYRAKKREELGGRPLSPSVTPVRCPLRYCFLVHRNAVCIGDTLALLLNCRTREFPEARFQSGLFLFLLSGLLYLPISRALLLSARPKIVMDLQLRGLQLRNISFGPKSHTRVLDDFGSLDLFRGNPRLQSLPRDSGLFCSLSGGVESLRHSRCLSSVDTPVKRA